VTVRGRKGFKSRRLLRWAALGAFCLVALAYYQPARRYLDARDTVATRQAEVQKLRAKHRLLARLVAASTSDAELAREARRLGLVKPGERLFIVKGIDRWTERHASVGRGG
jgi:cell division protein FtsB